MNLVEGVSNEVLIAFIITIILLIISVYALFPNERTIHGGNEVISNYNVDGSEANSSNIPSSNVNDDTRATRNLANDTGPTSNVFNDSQTERGSCDTATYGENVGRRAGNNFNVKHEQSEQSQEGVMVIKVKHNENIRSFNVSRNFTVLELKRLAFSNEMNAGKRIRFVYGGQLLRNDHDPLTSYGVQDNTVVHCVITDPPPQSEATPQEHEEELDLTRLLIPLLTVGLIISWFGLVTYKHIFTGSSIAILMFLTSLYFILLYVTVVQ